MAESETMSIDTHDTSNNDSGDDPLADLSDEQLYSLLEDTVRANEVLNTETQMFEKYLKRVEPKDMAGLIAGPGVTPSQSSQDVGRQVNKKRSKSRSLQPDKTQRLNAEQKCDIAQREIEELREDIDKLKEDSEKVLDTYKAIMEEADLRLSETKKESYEFERDIMKGSVNTRTNQVVAEKVTRHFEDKLRSRDTLIEKLRLKNSTLKVQKKKLHLQLKQKEEMGEVLHEVDFNQLKIENQQYLEKIDERNQDLLRLKMMAGNTLQVLNSYKKKLHTLTMESERLKSEITSRNDLLTKIDVETKSVEIDRAKAEKINRKLRQQLADYRVPEVMEYVTEKADLYELQKKVRSWERKVEIADSTFSTLTHLPHLQSTTHLPLTQPTFTTPTSLPRPQPKFSAPTCLPHLQSAWRVDQFDQCWTITPTHITQALLDRLQGRILQLTDGAAHTQKNLAADED